MAIASSEKVFIDAKDEIIFTVERVLDAEKDRIILVVPQNSLLLSSIVSINILFRKIVKSKKVAIIVTEDEYGTNIATKAGFIVVPKVSLITADIWDMAKVKKQKMVDYLDKRKKDLLSNISGEAIIPQEETQDFASVQSGVEADSPVAEIPEENITEISKIQEVSDVRDQISDITEEEKDNIETQDIVSKQKEDDFVDVEEFPEESSKPKVETKIANIAGITIFGGSDIKNYMNDEESDKIQDTLEDGDEFMEKNDQLNIGNRKIRTVSSGQFTGKDFTKAVSSENKFTSFFQNLFKPKRIIDPNDRFEGVAPVDKRKRNIIIGIGVILVLALLGGGYVMAFQTSTVNISLKLKKEDVSTSANVIVNPKLTEISENGDIISIPGKLIKLDKESISKTGSADGKGKRGNKSKGTIRIINKTTNVVNLPTGTKLTSVATNLKYQLTADTTIEAATDTGGVITAKFKDDVPLEATDIGAEYNITGTDSNTAFLVEGYDSSKLQATRYVDFTGGSSENFTSVSQENIDSLKETAIEELKTQSIEKIKQLIDSGYQLIEETIEFKEGEIKASPALNQEANKDGTFNLSVQMNFTALEIKQEDLIESVRTIISRATANSQDNKVKVDNINDPVIVKVQKDKDTYVLTVSSEGSVKAEVTLDKMKEDIAGKTIEQAEDYFSFLDYIEDYRITFSPAFVPEALQRIPSDLNRINISSK